MKKIIIVLLFVNIVCGAQIDLTQDLLVYYKFNGNMDDSSPNIFHGSGNATLTEDRFGNSNAAYHFNGIDEFIDMPDDDKLKPQLPITFAFWVNFEDIEVTKTFVFTTDYAQDTHTGINLSMTSASNNIAIAYGDGSGTFSSSRRTKIGTTQVDANKWFYVVGVINGPLDMNIYIKEFATGAICIDDGGFYSGSGDDISYTSNPGTIGRTDANSSTAPFYFNGRVDEFRMWDRALSVEEILELCESEGTLSVSNSELLMFTAFYDSREDYLKFNNLSSSNSVLIYNSLGQLLEETKNVKDEMDVRTLKTGLYIVKIRDDRGRIRNLKFIK